MTCCHIGNLLWYNRFYPPVPAKNPGRGRKILDEKSRLISDSFFQFVLIFRHLFHRSENETKHFRERRGNKCNRCYSDNSATSTCVQPCTQYCVSMCCERDYASQAYRRIRPPNTIYTHESRALSAQSRKMYSFLYKCSIDYAMYNSTGWFTTIGNRSQKTGRDQYSVPQKIRERNQKVSDSFLTLNSVTSKIKKLRNQTCFVVNQTVCGIVSSNQNRLRRNNYWP